MGGIVPIDGVECGGHQYFLISPANGGWPVSAPVQTWISQRVALEGPRIVSRGSCAPLDRYGATDIDGDGY